MKKTLTIALLIAMIIGSCKESTRKYFAIEKPWIDESFGLVDRWWMKTEKWKGQ